MKKFLIYVFIYPIAFITYWFDKLGDSIDSLFGSEKRIQELEDRVKELENK